GSDAVATGDAPPGRRVKDGGQVGEDGEGEETAKEEHGEPASESTHHAVSLESLDVGLLRRQEDEPDERKEFHAVRDDERVGDLPSDVVPHVRRRRVLLELETRVLELKETVDKLVKRRRHGARQVAHSRHEAVDGAFVAEICQFRRDERRHDEANTRRELVRELDAGVEPRIADDVPNGQKVDRAVDGNQADRRDGDRPAPVPVEAKAADKDEHR
ncbi:hypothetical protein AeNC1_019005, partial [Aphanomyces euteiches]